MSDSLFDLSTVEQKSPRILELEEHDIQTHFAPHCEYQYMAIPMNAARHLVKERTKENFASIAMITASYGTLLDDAGMVFQSNSKEEVETEALAKSIAYFKEESS